MAGPSSPERDLEMWRHHVRGKRQADIARMYGITQQSVCDAIARHRATIPEETRDQITRREVDYLTSIRDEVLALWVDTLGAPVTAGKDGKIVMDPKTQEVVRDHTGRLTAVRTALQITERLHKLTGLDAAIRVDITKTEADAANAAAAEAVAHLHGGSGAE